MTETALARFLERLLSIRVGRFAPVAQAKHIRKASRVDRTVCHATHACQCVAASGGLPAPSPTPGTY
jgi:hypothetical protein